MSIRSSLPASTSATDIANRISGGGFEIASIDGESIDFEITANPGTYSLYAILSDGKTADEGLAGLNAEVKRMRDTLILLKNTPAKATALGA